LSFEQKSEKNLLDKIENEIQKIEKQVLIIKDETKKQRTFWELVF
jgi:Cd2+/Zn2+-exporting ATPase